MSADQPERAASAGGATVHGALLWYATFLGLTFWSVLNAMVYQWQSDEQMVHGLFIPLIAGYMVWESRAELFSLPVQSNKWGTLVVFFGAVQLWVGTLGAELFLQRTAFLVTLFGIVLFYGGFALIRKLVLPFVLLFFMIPIPKLLLKEITFPLQLLASGIAESSLDVLGYMVIREGNVLELAGQELSVVEACSGLRALHTLSFFSISYAYLLDSRPWMAWFLLACTTPVAIAANAGRIVLTGVLGEYNQRLAQGLYHTASGWSLFVIAIGLLIIIHQLAIRTFARKPPDKDLIDVSSQV